MKYPDELIEQTKIKIIEQFDLLCKADYGKLTLNANRQAKSLEVVTEAHYRVSNKGKND